jgi:hypothetical protein
MRFSLRCRLASGFGTGRTRGTHAWIEIGRAGSIHQMVSNYCVLVCATGHGDKPLVDSSDTPRFECRIPPYLLLVYSQIFLYPSLEYKSTVQAQKIPSGQRVTIAIEV